MAYIIEPPEIREKSEQVEQYLIGVENSRKVLLITSRRCMRRYWISIEKNSMAFSRKDNMKKILFWVKKFVNGNVRYCKCFCPACPYYEQCKEDGVMD